MYYDCADAWHSVPVPYVRRLDDRADAVAFAERLLVLYRGRGGEVHPRLGFVKVYRADNELYVCWRWTNPVEWHPSAWPAEPPPRRRRWWRRLLRG